jgi:prepilin-type N-terminal cleavage/methylation domain-containing protein
VKKGFTLVEMLIVVAVLVTLMTMVFRLGNIGGDTSRRNLTISRLQRVENCLSGYYAAFGNYPPVRLHGSRSIYVKANSHGIQSEDDGDENRNIWGWNNIGEAAEVAAWNQVNAACRSQPVDACFPFPEGYSARIALVSNALREKANSGDSRYRAYWGNPETKAKLVAGFDDASRENIGRFNSYKNDVDWRKVQLFKFGLMSFLLPRYLVMMNGDASFFAFDQWKENNTLPRDPIDNDRLSWDQIHDYQSSSDATKLARVANIPSQSVTARWMPNLEGTVSSEHTWNLFGVVISSSDTSDRNLSSDNPNIDVYEPGDFGSDSHSQQYVLDYVSVKDGWGRELYYYSPAPYQSYVLWSAGPNGRTFPPWVPLDSSDLNAAARERIGMWTRDDYTQMSN